MITNDIFLKLVRIATKAASSHNSQPWLFRKEQDSIVIIPDFERSLPIVDPDYHALYISLGCAVENIVIASGYFGYRTKVEYRNYADKTEIVIFLKQTELIETTDLFLQINKRQCNRTPYDAKPVDPFIIKQILSELKYSETCVFQNKYDVKKLWPLIEEAIVLQMNNPDFRKELISWMRFSEKAAMQHGDGLWAACSKMPSLGKTVGDFVMKNFVTSQSEVKRWRNIFDKTNLLLLLSCKENTPEAWIKTGRDYQRLALWCTRFGISHAHVNMPCEETVTRQKMQQLFCKDQARPLLLLRLGYAESAPYSFRRNLNDLIIS